MKIILLVIALVLPARGNPGLFPTQTPGDAIAADVIPRFIGLDYIELGSISSISKFRSGIGHDYSDEFESCRTMKHYYRPKTGLDWSQIKIFAPVDGTIVNVYPEWAGTKIGISPTDYPYYTVEIFHVDLTNPLNVGDNVTTGQQLGTHIGTQTWSDIAISLNAPEGWRLVSYFDVMEDLLFSSYQARGIQSRTEMIISKEERDADPLECDGETYLTPQNPDDWVYIIYDRSNNGDYTGDGTSDIAIFRAGEGLWAIRGITRVYFGTTSDLPISGDYDGDGTAEIGIFRGSSGLWAIRGVTRTYFGLSADQPVPGDYDGDESCDAAIFREDSGLWAVRGISRLYFGVSGDRPVPGDYDGDGSNDIGLFRSGSGLWAWRNISRIYFGGSNDVVLPGDYDGNGTWEAGIFRPDSGLWAFRGVTRSYFGVSSDRPVPADYNGDSRADIGIFRNNSGLWAVQGISRAYFGTSGDIPVTR
jgi:hypothetical protein